MLGTVEGTFKEGKVQLKETPDFREAKVRDISIFLSDKVADADDAVRSIRRPARENVHRRRLPTSRVVR